jgi:hypothetical protein
MLSCLRMHSSCLGSLRDVARLWNAKVRNISRESHDSDRYETVTGMEEKHIERPSRRLERKSIQ